MTKGEEIYLNNQIGYLKGKVEAYEALLYSSGILKRPEIIDLDKIRSKHE